MTRKISLKQAVAILVKRAKARDKPRTIYAWEEKRGRLYTSPPDWVMTTTGFAEAQRYCAEGQRIVTFREVLPKRRRKK